MNGAEYYGNGKSNLRWKLTLAGLWIRHPYWMLVIRREFQVPLIVPPHTFGGEVPGA
ncbi:MAG TPA: hypothetical protein VMV92_41520 [Streptosporangiaceae bacterium]|nr:hypothetical protein [Streptosporangiaceae bacterium]